MINNEAGHESVLGILDQAAGCAMADMGINRAIVILLREDQNHAILSVGLSEGDTYLALESAQLNIMAEGGWI